MPTARTVTAIGTASATATISSDDCGIPEFPRRRPASG